MTFAGPLNMSQSAFSHALKRLRAQFDDELFQFSPAGMLPTPRAHQLAIPIGEALATLKRALESPDRPFVANHFHYNWHWFWHWGTGELGNNGVHFIDVARWGLGVDYPTRVTSAGGKYRYDDDQETPDTNVVTFQFPEKAITFEGLSWYRLRPDEPKYDISIHGEKGTVVVK